MWSELERSPPFRPIRALASPWSWAFRLVCEVALSRRLLKPGFEPKTLEQAPILLKALDEG